MSENSLKVMTVACLLVIMYVVAAELPVQNLLRRTFGETEKLREGDPRLILTGVNFGSHGPTAVINGRVLAESEKATLPTSSGPITLSVLKIEPELVVILIEGEQQRRLLRLPPGIGL